MRNCALSLLHLPAFVVAAAAMYWSSTLAGLLGYVQLWTLRGSRNDTYAAVRFLADFHRVRTVHVGRGVLYRAGPVMYLANHRSWADFFLDLLFLEGRPCTLSRLGVLFAFPVTLLSGVALRSVILFHRGPIADKQRFNSWLDRKLAQTSYTGLLVYPEGHRSTAGQSLPLKRGMLHYAYERKMPVQVVVSCNKDAVIAEKRLIARFGQTVGVSFSDLIDTSAFDSFEAFMREVQAVWDRQWALTDAADLAGLPPLEPAQVDMDYPLSIRLRNTAETLAAAALLLAVAAPATLRALRCAYMALGAAGPAATALLAVWLAASLWASSQAVDVRAGRGGAEAGRLAAAPALAAAPLDATAGKPAAAAALDGGGAGDGTYAERAEE